MAVNQSSNGEITYRGKDKLAIGVELYELLVDLDERSLKMRVPEKRPRALRGESGAPARQFEPAFIGGLDGDVFVAAGTASTPD